MEGTPEGGTILNYMLLEATGTAPSAGNITVLVIIITILLLFTAITAGAETAYFSLKAKDINFLKTKESSTARQAIRLLEQPQRLLATILVANNFINIAIVIATNLLVGQLLPSDMNPVAFFIIQVVVVTFLLVLFGEVLPKVYATQNNMQMALFSAPVLSLMDQFFRPVSSMLVSSTKYIEGKLGSPSSNISNEDFEQAIELTVGHTATKEEVNIFKGILKFGSITAKQIMRTRMDVCGVSADLNFEEVQQYAVEVGYSRMPAYKGSLDKVVGMIHTKDFLPHINTENFDWHALIRPAYFVHEGKFIEDLLKEFQQKRIHFAIVVDEFGGTSGIVTLEDIMEEIIGDIKDEFDEDDLSYRKLDDNNYIFEGKMLINDVCRIIGTPVDEFENIRDHSDSLAGLVLEIAGKFPALNEMLSYKNYDFTVMELNGMRISKIKMTISQPEVEE